jgi:ADP-ribose pyrophosphatase
MAAARVVYEARKFRVEIASSVDRDGRSRDYEVIRHSGAAVILPLLDDGRVVLIRNHRVSLERELLELPAGTLDPGEAPAAAAGRELTEETGYRAGSIEPLLSFYSTPGICDENMHVFLATRLTAGQSALEPGERIRVTPMEWAAAMQAVRDGTIADAKSIAALLYYAQFRRGA